MKKILIILLIVSNLSAWEVTTHRAFYQAVEESGNTQNLTHFIADSRLKNETYKNEIFEDYGMSYFEYIRIG